MRVSPATSIGADPGDRGLLARRIVAASMALLVTSIALVARPHVAHAGVQVALTPAAQTVTPGSDFYIDVMVTQPSDPYNAWEATLDFDTAALTYLPATPVTDEQGCLMLGTCSNACGGTVLETAPGPDSLYVFNALSCYQTFISAPGQLYHLHFRASTKVQQTTLSFSLLHFSKAGLRVNPVIYAPAQIGIGMAVTAVDPSATSAGLRLSASPNPARGSVTLAIGSERSGPQEITVRDIQGRSVRVLMRSWQAAGALQLAWDGTDDSGSRVAPGVYLVTLRVGNQQTQSRITLLQ
jgi:hypothetical protein